LYDNKISSVTVKPTGDKDEYKIALKINIDKAWIGDNGKDVSAINMNDYIDIGIFGDDTKDKNGLTHAHLLYRTRYKFTRGDHELTLIVRGKPKTVAIDPFGYLVDRNPNDNLKDLE
jgi:hypothetical protein